LPSSFCMVAAVGTNATATAYHITKQSDKQATSRISSTKY
jgi:hypothetical protein